MQSALKTKLLFMF